MLEAAEKRGKRGRSDGKGEEGSVVRKNQNKDGGTERKGDLLIRSYQLL